ncbi:hypothetical protein C8J57DRAFT_1232301 [Mycena rebaudengoi]|nr:hypothetical protein C8J57DRAFT_1232301 [Mycena rebaudengoi]
MIHESTPASITTCSLKPSGFYVTPVKQNAKTYGTVFLTKCVARGGVVIMEFSFNTFPPLAVNPKIQDRTLPTLKTSFRQFWNAQFALGNAIRDRLGYGKFTAGDGHMPPEEDEIADMKKDTLPGSVGQERWSSYDDLAPYDVVIGEVPLTDGQQKFMNAVQKFGIGPFEDPFTQVVLVTNTGNTGKAQPIESTMAATSGMCSAEPGRDDEGTWTPTARVQLDFAAILVLF